MWVAWTFRGSPVDGVTGRSGDLDTVGRYRGTRDSGEKGDGRYIKFGSEETLQDQLKTAAGGKHTALQRLLACSVPVIRFH